MPSKLTRSVSHTSDDIETCTTWEIAMQDFFKKNYFVGVCLGIPSDPKSGPPWTEYFTCALVDVMEVRTTRVHDPTYQQIRESLRDPTLRF